MSNVLFRNKHDVHVTSGHVTAVSIIIILVCSLTRQVRAEHDYLGPNRYVTVTYFNTFHRRQGRTMLSLAVGNRHISSLSLHHVTSTLLALLHHLHDRPWISSHSLRFEIYFLVSFFIYLFA